MSLYLSHFESAPTEIQDHICNYLSSGHCNLVALSRCNKRCRAASNVFLFKSIRITVLGREKLRSNIDKWKSVLGGSRSFTHVREVRVRGYMPLQQDDIGDIDLQDKETKRRILYDPHEDDPAVDQAIETAALKPLAELLECLPAISCLALDIANQVPRIILDALNQQTPESCRLKIENLRL